MVISRQDGAAAPVEIAMSKLDAFRTERRRAEAYHEKPRLGMVAIIVLIVLALAAGLAEIDLLPRYGADEFSSILFGAG